MIRGAITLHAQQVPPRKLGVDDGEVDPIAGAAYLQVDGQAFLAQPLADLLLEW